MDQNESERVSSVTESVSRESGELVVRLNPDFRGVGFQNRSRNRSSFQQQEYIQLSRTGRVPTFQNRSSFPEQE